MAENGFRAFQRAKLSPQDTQLNTISCNFLPKIKLNTVKPVLNGHSKEYRLSLNAGQKYCRMLQREHSAILSSFIKLQFVINIWLHFLPILKVSKGSKIRNRYNQVPHLTQDSNGKVTNSQLDTTNKSQEVSPFPAGDHKAHINRRAQRHSKHKTEQKHKRSTKEVPPWNGQ